MVKRKVQAYVSKDQYAEADYFKFLLFLTFAEKHLYGSVLPFTGNFGKYSYFCKVWHYFIH